jgi:hypothetical protein
MIPAQRLKPKLRERPLKLYGFRSHDVRMARYIGPLAMRSFGRRTTEIWRIERIKLPGPEVLCWICQF